MANQSQTTEAHAKSAAEAHTSLNMFHTVIQMLEGGCIYGATAEVDAQRIIAICKSAAAKQIQIMDKHVEAIRGNANV